MFLQVICALYLCLLVGFGETQVVLTATLDYGTFKGVYDSTYNISYWQKIPFAAPPVGQNR